MAAFIAARLLSSGSKPDQPRCPRCGHVLQPDAPTGPQLCIVLAVIGVFVWLIITAFSWLGAYDQSLTLLQVLQDQWHWLVGLTHRIW
jgi:hypothetical protein